MLRYQELRTSSKWLALSFICLHVPQSIVQIVDVFNPDSLVDFFSVGETKGWVELAHLRKKKQLQLVRDLLSKVLHVLCRHLHHANTKCMLFPLCHDGLNSLIKDKPMGEFT